MLNQIGIYITIFVIMIVLLILAFRLSLYMAKRAVCQVVTIFRSFGAVDYQSSQTLESLGLAPKPFFQLRLLRDYKPWALRTLIQAGIIRTAVPGTFYLSEETLKANTNIETICKIK